MEWLIRILLSFCLLIAGAMGDLAAQNLVRVILQNGGHGSIFIIAYDPICKTKVFEGVLARNGSITVRVCSDGGRRGDIVLYDRHGRGRKYTNIFDGSGVDIRFM